MANVAASDWAGATTGLGVGEGVCVGISVGVAMGVGVGRGVKVADNVFVGVGVAGVMSSATGVGVGWQAAIRNAVSISSSPRNLTWGNIIFSSPLDSWPGGKCVGGLTSYFTPTYRPRIHNPDVEPQEEQEVASDASRVVRWNWLKVTSRC